MKSHKDSWTEIDRPKSRWAALVGFPPPQSIAPPSRLFLGFTVNLEDIVPMESSFNWETSAPRNVSASWTASRPGAFAKSPPSTYWLC
ncbi:hypothetical protein D3C78_1502700 [compost metagenome]